MAILDVEGVDVAYGDLQVLWDLSLRIDEGESVVALVGPNGAGKTTLLRTVSGLLEPTDGRIRVFDEDVTGAPVESIVARGFVHVTEERNLFDEMTVDENLRMGAYTNREAVSTTREEVYEMFPVLEERMTQTAGTLSGGEQQMLAIGRGLMAGPRLLALDEPSGALAPQLAERVFEKIDAISDEVPVLLVEQHVDRALELADRAYLLENGRVATEGTGEQLLEADEVMDAYLRG